MREISFVRRLKFNFNGSVTKKALVIGDADNDQHNELVCANLQGDLAIFKDRNPDRYAYATDLGMVSACVIGDVINAGLNYVAAINTEGMLFIFDVPNQWSESRSYMSPADRDESTPTSGLRLNVSSHNLDSVSLNQDHSTANQFGFKAGSSMPAIKLNPLYDQRMPANCKELLLADLDGDGQNEVIVGLTDRVLRTYKWIKISPDRGKFVGLYKWEFADQIGAVSLNLSRHENCQDIIVAQPGGTYAKLECFDKKPSSSMTTSTSEPQIAVDEASLQQSHTTRSQNLDGGSNDGDNVRTEFISKLTPEYHQLALAQMRNHHISTEVLGGIRDGKNSKNYSLIVIATLDGTLMLVNKDEILWSLQVDHQLFALAILESRDWSNQVSKISQSESTCTIVPNDGFNRRPCTNNNNDLSQYFVVCAWNGKTYIIDEERNYLRFKFDEAVSAFTAGSYHFDDRDHASLVYATFNNQIILYYDVILDHIRPLYLLDEIMNNQENADLLSKLKKLEEKIDGKNKSDPSEGDSGSSSASQLHDLIQDLLYGLNDEEIINKPSG